MNQQELIESGFIELYCLGVASEEEKRTVEEMAHRYPEVAKEIAAVNDALTVYAMAASGTRPRPSLKEKILSAIQSAAIAEENRELPPLLTEQSKPAAWIGYLEKQNINPPAHHEGIYFVELPGTEEYYTYAVFGKKGDVVDEESHSVHNEFLLICSGECEMEIGGEMRYYKAGDFIAITPGIPHSAVVTGNDRMIAIGQRRAA